MTTVAADIAAITFDGTETALALARGTSIADLVGVANQSLNDLNAALENLSEIASTNEGALDTIQAKLM